MPSRVPRTVWILSLTSFLRDVASEMLVHLLPLFLANVLGVRLAVIGLIEGIAETTASLVKILSGWLSDRLGRRKGLTVAGYGLAALAMPLLLLVQTWPLVLLYRFLDRIGKGIRTAPRDALIADSVEPDQRGLSFGLHRAADSAGAFLGLLLAAVFVMRIQGSGVALDAETFRAIVTFAIVPAALAVLVVVVGVREAGRVGPPTRSTREIPATDARFRRFLVVMVLFTLGNSTDAFLVLRVQSGGTSVVAILVLLAGFNLVYTVLSGPAGALSDRIDRRKVMIAGWILYTLVYLGFAWADQTWQFALLYALYGAYYALTAGVAKAFVADLTPSPERRGAAYGLFHGVVGLTLLPASVIAGVLWEGIGAWPGFGPAAPFIFGSGLSLISVVLMWRWVK